VYVCTCVPGHPCQAADLYVYIDLVVAFLASSYVFWWCNNRSQSLYLYIIIKICLLSIEKKRPSSAFGPESIIYVWFFLFPRGIRSMFIWTSFHFLLIIITSLVVQLHEFCLTPTRIVCLSILLQLLQQL